MPAIICVPLTDLQRSPEPLVPHDFSHNALRESQLLFGDPVTILEEKEEWLKVDVPSQKRLSNGKEAFYEGWVQRQHVSSIASVSPPNLIVTQLWAPLSTGMELSFGTHLHGTHEEGQWRLPFQENASITTRGVRPLPFSFCRRTLLADAHKFLGAPYLWGGCGAPSQTPLASIDCSAYIYLLYRAQGILIPRDAHDQYLKCIQVDKEHFQPGDPLYLARADRPERITHVILYGGENTYFEAPETGKVVRTLSEGSDLWEEEGMIHFRDRPSPYFPFYGTFRADSQS